LRRFLREPLLHFCLFGSLIYIGFGLFNSNQQIEDNVIVVSSERILQLKSQFESTWKHSPTEAEINNLIEGHIREEVYYRGALNLALDRNDAVVRRRMHQKMEFLIDTGSYLEEPTERELEGFITENASRYFQHPRLAIEQLYLGEIAGPEKVTQSLDALNAGPATDQDAIGGSSFLPSRLDLSTAQVVDSLFGQGFFDQLEKSTDAKWVGPVVSTFGIHLVRITDRLPGRTPALAEIRDVIQKDWRDARAKAVRENDYIQRRSRFVIEIETDSEPQSRRDPR